uniref:Uncharacterized protein n=1 Tax=Amphimedon queenslandica TaxID=400682 RepID=A0A1X7T6G3_AMPQE
MSDNSRENQGRYSLRDLPRHDYRGQLRGLHIFRESYTSVDTEDCTEVEESLITGVSDPMEQLAAALASLTKLQEEQQRRWEEAQRQAEERRQEEERRREEAQRQAEERRREEERQRERHYEEIQAMQEQHMQQIEIMKGVLAEREGNSPHLKISPYQETEDIQDFIEAFEGIMKIQGVNRTNWILRLTPLLSGKARTVCTDLGTTTDYDGVKKAILERYNINTERCRRKFRSHVWTRDQDPTDWIARG